jgi:hypothetical protein
MQERVRRVSLWMMCIVSTIKLYLVSLEKFKVNQFPALEELSCGLDNFTSY